MKDATNARDRRTLQQNAAWPGLGQRIIARRAVDDQAMEYFHALVDMIGGKAGIEGSDERSKVWRAVWSMPAFCPERRRQVWMDAAPPDDLELL